MNDILITIIGVVIGAALSLVTGVTLIYFKDNRKEELLHKENLSQLITKLKEAERFWFLIVENYYSQKYDSCLYTISKKNLAIVSERHLNNINANSDNYEVYRLKMIEIKTEIELLLQRIRSYDLELAISLNKRIGKLKLDGWKIPDNITEVSERRILAGLTQLQLSYDIKKSMLSKGGISTKIRIIEKGIDGRLNQT